MSKNLRRGPVERGDRLIVETAYRKVQDEGLYLAVRLSDGRLTLIEGRRREVEHGQIGKHQFVQADIAWMDCETDESQDPSSLMILGSVIGQVRPDRSPIPYGGATEPLSADVRDRKNCAAVVLRDASMQPERERDTFVVYDKDVQPKEGDTVVACIDHARAKPRPKAWQLRALREWKSESEEYKDGADGFTVRRYEKNEIGEIVLRPLDPAFQSWTEGEIDLDGYTTHISIWGIAINAFVWARHGHTLMAIEN